ncbi:metalloregulator ArsR/SmtB family transcription factor [Bifidobacterium bombi]|uniref:Transcriptional regulator, ArsR family n=1 Tax=Bifidobacterium bombi DSM 19703 TaxID=1341695 RepID=A0A080N3J8_9BIFI|nr:metalloregulator ArsR/SmtB family transcription factor [Bifidobacterium bombi]KFF31737.1 transcriptional regulator, ArsR family [Bifidobacterium bombi DSM 19703]
MGVQTTLEALNDSARRRIIELLRTQTMSAGDLAEAVDLAPSRLSYHLNKLKAAGLVSGTRRGTTIYYESNLTVLDDTIVWLKGLQKREDASGSDDTENC